MRVWIVLSLLLLSGCQHYQAQPLVTNPVYAALVVPVASISGQVLPSHSVVPGTPLTLTELELLAVSHNPQLLVLRANAGVQEAQLVDAGLLPDPVLSGNRDHPYSGPDQLNAWSSNLSMDLGALLQHAHKHRAMLALNHQIHLDLLWQEWLILAQVRSLAYRIQGDSDKLKLARERLVLLKPLADNLNRALQHGNIDKIVQQPSQLAVEDTEQQIHNLTLSRLQDEQALHALLDLPPQLSLSLAALPTLVDLSVPTTPDFRHRPDMLALQAGYASADEHLRIAILGQFPDINLGINNGSDTTGTHTVGLSFQLPLPVFNGNRGHIAIAHATRDSLQQEYQERLTQAQREVDNLRSRVALLRIQITHVQHDLEIEMQGQKSWAQALASHQIDLMTYTMLMNACLQKRMDLQQVQQSLDDQQLALMSLLGIVPSWEYSPHA
ncbi:MAG: TolC family protein [Pseudomonadales bacterium]|nr:TolC family protein [Pseudomonadales bacterium]